MAALVARPPPAQRAQPLPRTAARRRSAPPPPAGRTLQPRPPPTRLAARAGGRPDSSLAAAAMRPSSTGAPLLPHHASTTSRRPWRGLGVALVLGGIVHAALRERGRLCHSCAEPAHLAILATAAHACVGFAAGRAFAREYSPGSSIFWQAVQLAVIGWAALKGSVVTAFGVSIVAHGMQLGAHFQRHVDSVALHTFVLQETDDAGSASKTRDGARTAGAAAANDGDGLIARAQSSQAAADKLAAFHAALKATASAAASRRAEIARIRKRKEDGWGL